MLAERLRGFALPALWAGVAWTSMAQAAIPAPTAADCASETHQAVLHPQAAETPAAARAIWLSARVLRWPAKSATSRYRLYHAARGGIDYAPGRPVRGADGALKLDVTAAPLPEAIATRFRYVADGVDLQVRAGDMARLAQRHRGQWLLVEEDSRGRAIDATRLQSAAALDELFAAAAQADDLGVRIGARGSAFAVWAPTAQRVTLCVFDDRAANARPAPMRRDDASGIWRASLAGDRSGGLYTYLVDVWVDGVGLVRNRVTDPYALSLDSDSLHAWIGDLSAAATQPDGWRDDRAPSRGLASTDLAIYELHVRDFSIGDATVPAPQRGKYLAFTVDRSDGMRHLRALAEAGMTDVHLLPVFDYATVPETGCVTPSPEGGPASESQQATVAAVQAGDCYNWGYDPWHYSAPEGSYASDANDPAARVRELRAAIQALHRAGLRVGMDVVYNHTSASGQDPKSLLDRIVPGYYHRLDADGVVERSTCCANTATEHAMMAKLMIDSAVVWARDYHVDSFRFDLMGHQPRAAMEALQVAVDRAAGRHIHLIGEGWNYGEVANGARFVQAAQGSLNGSGIGTFNDRLRDALRGGGCCDSGEPMLARQGWLNGLYYAPNAHADGRATRGDLLQAADLVRVGMAGSLRDVDLVNWRDQRVPMAQVEAAGQPAGYASAPGEVVNYVENHDNPTLFDINAMKLPAATTAAERARVQMLGMAVVAFSQGVAYFHAGIDTLRSKSLDRNSFDSGDWFNRIDWSYRDNHYASGLPPEPDNGADWPLLRPLLENASAKPMPADIAWTRDAFRDLLRIRAGSSLFHLRSAAEVSRRLRHYNTGSTQQPTVVALRLDGRGYPGANFAAVLVLINVDASAHQLAIGEERDQPWQLHPQQAAATAIDTRPRESARYDRPRGTFTVPPRSAVVYVQQP